MKSLLPKPKPIHPAKIFELVEDCAGVARHQKSMRNNVHNQRYYKNVLIYLLHTKSQLNYKQIADLTGFCYTFVVDKGAKMLKRMEIQYEEHLKNPNVRIALECLKYLEPI